MLRKLLLALVLAALLAGPAAAYAKYATSYRDVREGEPPTMTTSGTWSWSPPSTPTTVASGQYLNVQARVIVYFDATTKTSTPVGPSAYDDACTEDGNAVQCGECGYVPTTSGSWKSAVAQYTYGRCASVDVADPAAVTLRADLRVTRADDEDWWTDAIAVYQRFGVGEVGREGLYFNDCRDVAMVAACEARPGTYDLTGSIRDTEADVYCVYTRIFNTKVLNAEPQVEAPVCKRAS